ncbi:MAG TPA: di-heme oxidoredictase family protein [Nitrospiria bacterium]|nr:di-heme oxidoredictase family protein [Nitrospiria bacterium]
MRHDQSNRQRRYRHEPGAGIVRRIREIYAIPAGLVVAALFVMAVSPKYIHAFGTQVKDPGVQNSTTSNAGNPLPGLTPSELALFQAGQKAFEESEGVADGLGPRFNMDSCGGCHAQPAVGGSSPAVNPQVAVATAFGADNKVPFFITSAGPVREARFKHNPDGTPDGGVHDLFVVSGRIDNTGNANNCTITQEDFSTPSKNNNLIFRIPTPVFGGGLIEQIPDSVIVANQAAATRQKASIGISGRPHRIRMDSGTTNKNGNDGTIARFGWKAQNKSLLLFAGEAYNVEMGISNELFQSERDETQNCQFAPTPNDITNTGGTTPATTLSDLEKFAHFMRFLAPPTPSQTTPGGAQSIENGRALFQSIGCAYCHTPALRTGNAAVTALANKDVNLYSDLLLHHMGPGLADEIAQAQADPDEFRTAPLWGLGQRIFLLHDGRTTDLVQAIFGHKSAGNTKYKASEANGVVNNFNNLGDSQRQDLLNFLRSL